MLLTHHRKRISPDSRDSLSNCRSCFNSDPAGLSLSYSAVSRLSGSCSVQARPATAPDEPGSERRRGHRGQVQEQGEHQGGRGGRALRGGLVGAMQAAGRAGGMPELMESMKRGANAVQLSSCGVSPLTVRSLRAHVLPCRVRVH